VFDYKTDATKLKEAEKEIAELQVKSINQQGHIKWQDKSIQELASSLLGFANRLDKGISSHTPRLIMESVYEEMSDLANKYLKGEWL